MSVTLCGYTMDIFIIVWMCGAAFAYDNGGSFDPLSDCVLKTENERYTGTVSVTNNGIPCQDWASSSPHNHTFNQNESFPADGSVHAAKNYCRNFAEFRWGSPFCVTTNPDIIDGDCTLRICNGTSQDSLIVLESPTGVISSPDRNEDGMYDNNVDIMWMIEAATMKLIRYQLLYVEVEISEGCKNDALRIFEPDRTTDHFWFCNNLNPLEGETKSNVMFVHFVSDHKIAGAGFQLSYIWVIASNKSCDEYLEQPFGYISSPDQDRDGFYDYNVFCIWTVRVAENYVIEFHVFYVHIQYTDRCIYSDYLKITDTIGPISILCGNGMSVPKETRTNVMYVKFSSNGVVSFTGFNMSYGQIQKTVEICGGVLGGMNGTVVAPDSDLDGQYDENVNCFWIIEAKEGYVIRYMINYIMIEGSKNGGCTDYLLTAEVSRDGTEYSQISYCGTVQNRDGESISNVFIIEFRSDNTTMDPNINFSGFNITYVQRKEHLCEFELKNNSGIIRNPDIDLDGAYDFNTYCAWGVTVSPKNRIQYKFLYVSLNSQPVFEDFYITHCVGDYIRLVETLTAMVFHENGVRPEPYYQFVSYWCGSFWTTEEVSTYSNNLLLVFVTDNRLSGGGFMFAYIEKEGDPYSTLLTQESGWISAPDENNDGHYDNGLYCYWHVKGQKGEKIKFEIVYSRLEDSPGCGLDFLTIGFLAYQFELIFRVETICGVTQRQAPALTWDSELHVLFMTNQMKTDFGFLLKHKRVNESSVHRYNKLSPPGFITSADLDNDGLYDYNSFQKWGIHTDPKKRIIMEILYIDIEPAFDCARDILAIQERLLAVLCGTGTKVVIIGSDQCFIVFVSDYTINRTGFSLTFFTIDGQNEGCGDDLTSSSGVIASIDEDSNGMYDNSLDCLWTVRLSTDQVIIFKFLEMDIHTLAPRCDVDYLELREEHKRRGKFCGKTIPASLTTEANVLYVHFFSDHLDSGRGFEAVYVQAEDKKSCSAVYECLLSEVRVLNSFVCDNYNDCPNGDDERFCDFRCPVECVCYGLHVDCSGGSDCQPRSKAVNTTDVLTIPSTTRGFDVNSNRRLYDSITLDKLDLPLLFYMNLSNCEIEEIPQTMFYSMQELRTLDISHNKISRLASNMFLYQIMLEKFILIGNIKSLVLEPESFNGLSSLQFLILLNLHIKYISRDTFANLKLDELSISYSTIDAVDINSLGRLQAKYVFFNTTEIKTMSKSMFDGIQNVDLFKTDEYKFCCVKPLGVSSENCFPKHNEISSCDDLIRNEVLIPLIWLIGFFSVLTNGASLLYRFARQREQLKRNYGIFVSHLAVSDTFMGIYLIIIAAADTYYRGIYIYNDNVWRESILCQSAGVLSLVSSESSVMLICLITLDRFLVVKYPLGQVRIEPEEGKKLALLVLAIALFLAILPVTIYPIFEGKFYSASGVCLALPITQARPPGWIYSFIISVGLNFVACFLVSYGQWRIHKEIKLSEAKMQGSRLTSNSESNVARNLLVVAVTNVLCWLPICILGILALAGNAIQGEVYSWVAVVVLPINSSVNPVIYTLLTALQKEVVLLPVFYHIFGTKIKKEAAISEAEEVKANVIFTSDDVDRQKFYWTSRFFWQYPGQSEGFSALSTVLERDDLLQGQRLKFANDVTKLIHKLHDKNVFQRDLKLDDIFVAVTTMPGDNMRIVLRPMTSTKEDDYLDNIRTLGLILEQILGIKQT